MATITTAFSNNGAPATGLSPTIRIRRVDTQTLVVTDAAATEIGEGAYFYDFTTFDPTLNYTFRFDGGVSLGNADRYTYGTFEVPIDDDDSVRLDASGLQDSSITASKFAAGAIDAAAIATDAIGSAELATSAVNEIRDAILSDSTPFAGANIDAAISSVSGADSTHLAVAFTPSSNAIKASMWMQRDGGVVTSPTAATISWYDQDGTLVFSHSDIDSEITGPDAQGVYLLQKTQALSQDRAYYVVLTITDVTGAVTSNRGVPTVG